MTKKENFRSELFAGLDATIDKMIAYTETLDPDSIQRVIFENECNQAIAKRNQYVKKFNKKNGFKE